MNSCTLSLFELYMVLFGLFVLSITSLLPLSLYLWITPQIPFYYGFIPITIQIALLSLSIKYLNFIRFLLYPFRWLAITQVLYFALSTAIIKRLTTFYKHISPYDSLTNLYSNTNNNKISKKQRKNKKKARNKMLKRVPKLMNKLKKTHNLQIKTISANYLKREHFKLLVEHATIMTVGKGKSILSKYNQILELFLVIFFSIGIIDEFYFNGKLVAFQYGVVINESYTSFQWYCCAESRKHMLYFEGIRRELKRCIAHPDIEYYNLMYTSSDDPGPNQAKLECGMEPFLVNDDDKEEDINILGEIYGYIMDKCCCVCCWVELKGVDEEYWDIKDESDDWSEEKELVLKKEEDERKKQERYKQQQKQGRKSKKKKDNVIKENDVEAPLLETTDSDKK